MTKEFLYDNKIFDGTPPSLFPSPISQNIFRKVDSNKSSYLSNEDDIIKRINNNKQADIFNNFASFNSTDSSTPLINESESKYFRNDNINNFDMINTGKFDKFENNILGENNTLDSITEKTQKQSDQYKNKICDEINLKGNKRDVNIINFLMMMGLKDSWFNVFDQLMILLIQKPNYMKVIKMNLNYISLIYVITCHIK